ncbi:MAG: hypothetical protein AB7E60_11660 [Sphingobium sp.]
MSWPKQKSSQMIWANQARDIPMGNIHSGRSDKPLVDDCRKLDLAWLMRLGPIREGRAGSGEIKWSADGIPIGSARFRLDFRDPTNARLTLQFHTDRADKPQTTQSIALIALPQRFGGVRWWMICPLSGRRVRTLLLPPGGDRFASREALGLSYRIERLTASDRPFEKLHRAQRRIGGGDAMGAPLQRPKGMWRRTYARHLERAAKMDLDCLDHIARFIGAAQ